MTEPIWLSDKEAVAINARALTLFGGLEGGVRDETLFQAALARPLNKWHYEEQRPDIFELAAAYAFALCKGRFSMTETSARRSGCGDLSRDEWLAS